MQSVIGYRPRFKQFGHLGLRNTLSLTEGVGAQIAYEAEAAALFTRYTTQPGTARKVIINDFIRALKDAGVWSKLDALYMLNGEDAQSSLLNWKQSLYNLTAVNSPTFIANQGYAGNGTSSYLDTGFIPNTAGGNFIQNSAHMALTDRTSRAANGTIQMGAATTVSGNQCLIATRATGDIFIGKVNETTSGSIASTESAGRFYSSRTASGSRVQYKDGASLGSVTASSSGLAVTAIVLLAYRSNNVSLFTSDQLAHASFGSGLTADEVADYDAALVEYYAAIDILVTTAALLAERTLVWDRPANEFKWAGATKTLADATDQGGGAYTINDGTWWDANNTVMLEYELFEDVAMGGSGDLFSWANASNHRYEFGAHDTDKFRLYFSQGNEYAYPTWEQLSAGYRAGRHRPLAQSEPGQAIISRVNGNAEDNVAGAVLGTFSAPTRFGILRGERFGTPATTNITFHRAWGWNRLLTQDERRLAVTAGNYRPVHLIGDSFLNSGILQEQLALKCRREYIALSQDGVGGSSLADQATRFAATPEFYGDTLIIMDGGLEDDEVTALASIQDMVARFGHQRWYYVEPSPNTYASVQAWCGDHFIPVTAAMQAANDGSANDLADVANGLVPRSLRIDSIHENAAGTRIRARVIHAYISARGHMPL